VDFLSLVDSLRGHAVMRHPRQGTSCTTGAARGPSARFALCHGTSW
jgi:hypothetical protein